MTWLKLLISDTPPWVGSRKVQLQVLATDGLFSAQDPWVGGGLQAISLGGKAAHLL